MKTFVFPVHRTVTTKGHIRVQAETLEEARDQVEDQVQLQKGFVSHHATSTAYELQPHSQSYQDLLGDKL